MQNGHEDIFSFQTPLKQNANPNLNSIGNLNTALTNKKFRIDDTPGFSINLNPILKNDYSTPEDKFINPYQTELTSPVKKTKRINSEDADSDDFDKAKCIRNLSDNLGLEDFDYNNSIKSNFMKKIENSENEPEPSLESRIIIQFLACYRLHGLTNTDSNSFEYERQLFSSLYDDSESMNSAVQLIIYSFFEGFNKREKEPLFKYLVNLFNLERKLHAGDNQLPRIFIRAEFENTPDTHSENASRH